MRGSFITFEGGEGSGKSTQIALLEKAFASCGVPCMVTREPGGTANAELVRNLLVSGTHDAWDPVAETLLFYAARLEHVNRLIKPALAANTIVLCDRFADSTMVYQGVGKGLPAAYIANLHRMTLGNFRPDLTLVLDIDPAVGLKRAAERRGNETRFENLDIAFHQQVRAGFLRIADAEPERCVVLAADQDRAALHARIAALVGERLGMALTPHV